MEQITAQAEAEAPAVAAEAAVNPASVQLTVEEEAAAVINGTTCIQEWMKTYIIKAKAGKITIPNPTKKVAKFPTSIGVDYDEHAGLTEVK